jgi:hypothetical protein
VFGSLQSSLEHLEIPEGFESVFSRELLLLLSPLQEIVFYCRYSTTLIKSLDKDSLPASLVKFSLQYYDQGDDTKILKPNSFPESIRHLKLHQLEQDIVPGLLPSSLVSPKIYRYNFPNYTTHPQAIASTLKRLIFEFSFHLPLQQNMFPSILKEIHFCYSSKKMGIYPHVEDFEKRFPKVGVFVEKDENAASFQVDAF